MRREAMVLTPVYVGNIGHGVEEAELYELFKPYGDVYKVWVARRPGGFAFVEFWDRRGAEDAVRALHGHTLGHQRLAVELRRNRRPPGRSFGPPSRSPSPAPRPRAPRSRSPPRSRSRTPLRRRRSSTPSTRRMSSSSSSPASSTRSPTTRRRHRRLSIPGSPTPRRGLYRLSSTRSPTPRRGHRRRASSSSSSGGSDDGDERRRRGRAHCDTCRCHRRR